MGYNFGKYWFLEGEERMRVYRKTASRGDLTSMKELAYILKTDLRTPQDLKESFKWYLKASAFHDSEATLAVGDMLRDGIGTDKDPVKAIDFYKKVVNNRFSKHIDRKNAINKIAYTYEKFLNDNEKAVQWLQKSFRLGDLNSRVKIAKLYRDENSGEKSVEWFQKILDDKSLPEQDRYSAALEIAKIFHDGKIIEKSDQLAIKYLKIATKAEIPIARNACNGLVQIYSTSDEITPNIGMAIYWLRKAAELGSRHATLTISKIFSEGKFGVRQDGEKALKILEESLANEFDTLHKTKIMNVIADMYSKGQAIPKNQEKADNLHRESARIRQEWFRALNNLQNLNDPNEEYHDQVKFDEEIKNDDALNFKYSQTPSGYQLDKYLGNEVYVTIPSKYNGQPVTSIGYRALDKADLLGVTIPASVKIVAPSAIISKDYISVFFEGSQIQLATYSFIAPGIALLFRNASILETLQEHAKKNENCLINY